MIIRNIGFLVCMLVVCSLNINTAMAQSRSYEGGITVNPVRLEQKGDFIHVDIDFVLNNVKVKSAGNGFNSAAGDFRTHSESSESFY